MTLDHRPQKIDAMNRLAWLYAKKRVKIERGIALIQTVMQANPNSAKYIDTLSELLYAKGDVVAAVKSIREAIRLDPENSYYKQQIWKFQNVAPESFQN
jgi:cytochrome c-type biogenesis protein CcmH/NrfG